MLSLELKGRIKSNWKMTDWSNIAFFSRDVPVKVFLPQAKSLIVGYLLLPLGNVVQ